MSFLNFFNTVKGKELKFINIKKIIGFDEAIVDSIFALTQTVPKLLIDSQEYPFGLEFTVERDEAEKIMKQLHQKLKNQGYLLFYLSFFNNLGLIESKDQFDILSWTGWWGFNETDDSNVQIKKLKILEHKYPFDILGGSGESLELYFRQIPRLQKKQLELISEFDNLFPDAEMQQQNDEQRLRAFIETQSLVYRS